MAVNVKSKQTPSELEYVVVEGFDHPIIDRLFRLKHGFHEIEPEPGDIALDYVRGNLFSFEQMLPLEHDRSGPANDLNERIEAVVARAIHERNGTCYAFGEPWGPLRGRDRHFGFAETQGLHNVHMNQGSHERYARNDGTWQDGALLFECPHAPLAVRWTAVFLKFQSQTRHSRNRDGLAMAGALGRGSRDGIVRIVGVQPRQYGSSLPAYVTLLNASASDHTLDGWRIVDRHRRSMPLGGQIRSGETWRVSVGEDLEIAEYGAVVSVLDRRGIRIDGVAYTSRRVRGDGWTVTP